MNKSKLTNAQNASANMNWRFVVALCCIMICCMNTVAQRRTLKGHVVAENEPVIGATLLLKGTTIGTTTDMDGNFTLQVPQQGELVVSYVGYKTQTVSINGKSFLNIELIPDAVTLKDVVVVGYGTQRKVNLTGAVTSISNETLKDKPVANALEALQGTSPGLVIQQGSSNPGTPPSLNIRGLNTMNNNDPLVIVDGIEGSIANLNPADIDQISILKDASSTAIYGSRASNGVVLITTKRGSQGRTEVNYNFMYGYQEPTSLPNIADSWIYAELYNEAAVNSGRNTKFTTEQIKTFREQGPNVKWIRELYKKQAPEQSHNLSITGGNDKFTYLASVGYFDQASMFKGPDYGYQRYNARLNVSHQVTKQFKLNLTSQFTRNDIKEHAYWTEWIIEQANRMPPIYPIKNEDGTYTYPSGSNSNSLQRLEQGGQRRNENDELLATLNAEWEIFNGFKLSGTVGTRMWNNFMHENRKAFPGTGDAENKLTEQYYRSQNMTSTLVASYNKQFGKHSLGLLVGYGYEGFSDRRFSTSRITKDSKYDIFVNSLKGNDVENSGGAGDWSIYSGFTRATYNYAEKYLFEFNLRNDYSSYFAKGNRSGLFPSLSAGWRISEESFWKGMKNIIPSLKLRGSWGMVGNNRIGAYQYMQTVTVTNDISFGDKLAQTARFASANKDIKWETTTMLDFGLDLGLLNDNLNLTFDIYRNTTRNILVNLPVPGLFGNGSPTQNAGKVGTNGWEITANYRFNTGKFKHSITANLSDSRNKVLDTHGVEIIGGYDVQNIIKEGYPLYSYYAYRADGFFNSEEECQRGPHLEGITPKPGDIRYLDKNGDGLIKPDDDRFIVGNDFPRYTYGLTYNLDYKGFHFSMMWQGVGKRSRWMRGESVEAFHNNNEGPLMDFHIDRWTPTNTDASYPRLTLGSESANNAAKSDFWIQNAQYLRLKNIRLGYSIPNVWLTKYGIKDFQLYISAQNLLTFSRMKGGWDPEYNADGSGRAYPVAKVYSMGINVKF